MRRDREKLGDGRPVKLVWTREDDMTAGRYRPLTHHAIAIKTDGDGMPAMWRHRIVTQSILKEIPTAPASTTRPSKVPRARPISRRSRLSTPRSICPISASRCCGGAPSGPRIRRWPWSTRSISWRAAPGGIPSSIAARSMPKPATRLPATSRSSTWPSRNPAMGRKLETGWAHGVAVHESFGSVVAQVAEVSLDNGEPRVRRVVTAIDCGTPIAPNQIAAQMEAAPATDIRGPLRQDHLEGWRGRADQFRQLPCPAHERGPPRGDLYRAFDHPPSGVGEPGTPVIAPAVANALLVLTGKPTTSLPFVQA